MNEKDNNDVYNLDNLDRNMGQNPFFGGVGGGHLIELHSSGYVQTILFSSSHGIEGERKV